jgi:hypothetical protein
MPIGEASEAGNRDCVETLPRERLEALRLEPLR